MAAAEGGHVSVLQWCQDNGCLSLHKDTCNHAAMRGRLNVLKWCREHGSPCNEYTCAYAAMGGHVEILEWCVANDCPWDMDLCLEVGKHHPHIAEWIDEYYMVSQELIFL